MVAQTLRPEREIPTKNIFRVPIETQLYEYQINDREETGSGNEFTDTAFVRMLEIRRVVVSPICNQLGVPFQINLCEIASGYNIWNRDETHNSKLYEPEFAY